METLRATVEAVKDEHFIRIENGESEIRIPMSSDNPNEVKGAFNQLIVRLKAGLFRIDLEEGGSDLFSQVADEYIKQLNREIEGVYGDMESYGLIEAAEEGE